MARLQTAGKYCVENVLVYAEPIYIGGSDTNDNNSAAGGDSGGGLPEGISAIATGTIQPTSNIASDYTVTHNLGKKPDFAVLMLLDDAATAALTGAQLFQMLSHKPFKSSGTINQTRGLVVYQNTNGAAANTIVTATDSTYVTETTVKFRALSTYPLKAGYTYIWICGALS